LCDYFQQSFTIEQAVDGSLYNEKKHECTDSLSVEFDEITVLRKLQELKTDKSPGPDGLHPMLLKSCADELCHPLSLIFQKSYDTGVLPDDWKTQSVCPIYKKGNRSDPANYRPVSLTCIPCKLMESIVRDQVLDFVNTSNILTCHQHGFRKRRSCLTNLLETFEAWTSALDEGFGIDVIYLDYKKAFDTVPHNRLMMKLTALGLPEKILSWIHNFLTDRKMRVGLRGSFSAWAEVLSGVPQGSILGPLLFILFVNDLPDWIKSEIKMFADDTKIWCKITQQMDSTALQNDLIQLQHWTDKWLLKLNPEKCKVMHIGHSYHTKYQLCYNGHSKVLGETSEEKDLGVYVSNSLKPSTQSVKSANSFKNGEKKFSKDRQGRLYSSIQDIHQASYGVLCTSLVTVHG